MKKLRLGLVFAIVVCLTVSLLTVMSVAEETALDISTLISQLPEVSDPMGTQYYYYNQLNDIEKALYWELTKATWEDPDFVVSGLGMYSQEEVWMLIYKAQTALFADQPIYNMYWNLAVPNIITEDSYIFSLEQTLASHYIVEKANARIDQIVETVGVEGDMYSRTLDIFNLLIQGMCYDPYYPFYSQIKQNYNNSSIGCLVYNIAVCAGFSDTVKILCDRLNIPCLIVGNAGHAWNFIRMEDGNWYSIDAARYTEESFPLEDFLVGSETFSYLAESNYHLSDLYMGEMGFFTFPSLSKEQYVYSGVYESTYHDAETIFEEPEATFVYTVNDDGISCTVIGYEGEQCGDLVIPDSIDGYTVTAIGDCAFYAHVGFTGNLIIPDTVTSIGDGAFQQCTGLSGELDLPDSLVSIGKYAFMGNKALSGELLLPDSLKVIDTFAFYDCVGFTGDLVLPKNIEIVNKAFSYCSGLTGTLYLPDNLEYDAEMSNGTGISAFAVRDSNTRYAIYDGVLYSKDMKILIACPAQKVGSLNIPETVEHVARTACYECYGLTGELKLPPNLKSIGAYAFTGTFLSGNIILPDTLESIGQNAFAGTQVVIASIPQGLNYLEEQAFRSSKFTEAIIVPSSLSCIDENAFHSVHNLNTVFIPASITMIGHHAFAYSGSLRNVYFYGDVPAVWGATLSDGDYSDDGGTVFYGPGSASDFVIHYLEGTDGWTTPTWTAPDGTVYNTAPFTLNDIFGTVAGCSAVDGEATVKLMCRDFVFAETETENGRYAFEDVPSGDYTVIVSKNGNSVYISKVTVENADIVMNETDYIVPITFSGKVINGNSDFQVVLWQNGLRSRIMGKQRIQEDGSFVIENLFPGKYTVEINSDGYSYYFNIIELSADMQIKVALCIDEHPSVSHCNAIDPTCVTPGYSGDYVCDLCGSLSFMHELGSEIPATGEHVGEWALDTLPELGVPGLEVYICDTCNTVVDERVIPALTADFAEDVGDLRDVVLTEDEKQQVEAGSVLQVELKSEDISETVSQTEKDLIAEKVSAENIGIYLDIDLIKYIGNSDPIPVTETSAPIKVTVAVPEAMLGEGVTYQIARIHGGIVDIIDGIFDPETKTFTFETDKFSTYVLIVKEESAGILGDVNGDTIVNSDDAVAILRYLAGYDSTGYDIDNGDFNSDNVTNSDDAVAILRMLAGYTD